MFSPANFYKKIASVILPIKPHAPAVLLAIIIGIATGAPQFYVIHQMGNSYQSVFPETGNDDRYYMSRSHEVRDGFPMLGNPYIYELRDAPAVSFWMPDAALSYAGEIVGLDVQHTFALFDFLLPPLLFLITYMIGLYATGRRIVALLSAAVFHLGFFLTTFFRSPSPQLNFLFVELAALFGMRLIQGAKYATAALAVTLGVLFYMYPFYWTFAFGAIGTFFLFCLLYPKLRLHAPPVFWALSGGVVVGLPTLVQAFELSHMPAYQQTVVRLGLIMSHTPTGLLSIVYVGALCISFAFLLYYVPSLRGNAIAWFLVAMSVGGILIDNTQLLTGEIGQFSSHYYLPIVYVVFLAAGYLTTIVFREIRNADAARILANVSLGTAILISAIGGAVSVSERLVLDQSQLRIERYGSIIRWLNTNTPTETVVFTGEELSSLIPAYTADRIFYARNANLHIMTDDEVWTRFLLEYRDANLNDEFLNAHIGPIWGVHPYDQYGHEVQLNKLRKLIGLPPASAELLPNDVKAQFRNFAVTLKKEPVQDVLDSRRIDYAVSSPDFILPKWLKQVFPAMQAVYTSDDMTIFKLGPEKK
jgi:hypothetical protein